MRRTDFFLVLILVVLVIILVVGIALRPQAGTPQAVASIPTDLQGRLAAAQVDVEALQAQLALPTPVPGSVNFDEWETLNGDRVSIALPARFEGGEFSEAFIDAAVEADPSVAEVLQSYRSMLALVDFALFAYDSEFQTEQFATNLNITRTPLEDLGGVDINTAFDAVASQLPPGLTLIRRDLVTIQGQTALRLDVENTMMGIVPLRQLGYVLMADNVIYTLTYTAPNAEYGVWLPIFEISARTFAITG
jgi:hypothetical protein